MNMRSERAINMYSLLVMLTGWQLSVLLFSPSLLPSPMVVLHTLSHEIHRGDLIGHMSITLVRVFTSFFLAMLLGGVLGILMGQSSRLNRWLDGPLTVLLNIPALVTVLLCFIWIGLNEWAVITAVTINKVPNVAVTLREGARAIDQGLLQVAKVYALPWLRFIRHVYLPQLYPYILAAARSGLALVWKIVLVVELLGCSEGVGFQLSTFFQFFDIASILAYALSFAGLVYCFDQLVLEKIQQRVSRWR